MSILKFACGTCKRRLTWGGPLDETAKTARDIILQQVWHNKDPSLLKGPKRQAMA